MPNPVRVELTGALAGEHVLVDLDQITVGLLEDVQASDLRGTLDGLAACVVGGDRPGLSAATADERRRALRLLTFAQFASVSNALGVAVKLPKAP